MSRRCKSASQSNTLISYQTLSCCQSNLQPFKNASMKRKRQLKIKCLWATGKSSQAAYGPWGSTIGLWSPLHRHEVVASTSSTIWETSTNKRPVLSRATWTIHYWSKDTNLTSDCTSLWLVMIHCEYTSIEKVWSGSRQKSIKTKT